VLQGRGFSGSLWVQSEERLVLVDVNFWDPVAGVYVARMLGEKVETFVDVISAKLVENICGIVDIFEGLGVAMGRLNSEIKVFVTVA
jgi:hypothetical protein